MEIRVKEQTKKRFVFELKGATHTFCNVLKEELWNDKSIAAAAYTIEHPLIGTPKFIVETGSAKEPKKALTDAISRLQKKNSAFSSELSKLKF